MRKVSIEIRPDIDFGAILSRSVRYMAPYAKPTGPNSKLTHRVRSANHHWIRGRYSHTSINYLCGNSGVSHRVELKDSISYDDLMCANCQGRLEGLSEKRIGMVIKSYSPRRINNQ